MDIQKKITAASRMLLLLISIGAIGFAASAPFVFDGDYTAKVFVSMVIAVASFSVAAYRRNWEH